VTVPSFILVQLSHTTTCFDNCHSLQPYIQSSLTATTACDIILATATMTEESERDIDSVLKKKAEIVLDPPTSNKDTTSSNSPSDRVPPRGHGSTNPSSDRVPPRGHDSSNSPSDRVPPRGHGSSNLFNSIMPPQTPSTETLNDPATEQISALSTASVNNKRSQHESSSTDSQPATKKAKSNDLAKFINSARSDSDPSASGQSGSHSAVLERVELLLNQALRDVQREQAIVRDGSDSAGGTPQDLQSLRAEGQEQATTPQDKTTTLQDNAATPQDKAATPQDKAANPQVKAKTPKTPETRHHHAQLYLDGILGLMAENEDELSILQEKAGSLSDKIDYWCHQLDIFAPKVRQCQVDNRKLKGLIVEARTLSITLPQR
jgi:hypothetical protein